VNLLLSMLGESFQPGKDFVRDVLGNFKGDVQKSSEVLLRMVSSTSPQSPKINSTNTQDGWHSDYKDVRVHSSHQLTKAHLDNPPMQNSMEHQRFRDDYWNGPNMVTRAGNTANSYTDQKSETDQDHSKIKPLLNELKEIFPHVDDRSLFDVLQSNNFVLGDAVQFLLDTTAHKHSTNSPAGSKVDHGNRSNILKTNVRKDSGDSLGTTQPAPLRASWADVKPNITPFKLYLADASLKCGLPEKSSNGKNGMAQFKSYGDFDNYGRQRQCAQEHWNMMHYYFREVHILPVLM
jgi:hypothetical protein